MHPTAEAAGGADGEGEDSQAEEGDRQHQARHHGEASNPEPDHGEAPRHQVEGQLGQGTLGKWFPQDAARALAAAACCRADGQGQTTACRRRVSLAFLDLFHRHGHRRSRPGLRLTKRRHGGLHAAGGRWRWTMRHRPAETPLRRGIEIIAGLKRPGLWTTCGRTATSLCIDPAKAALPPAWGDDRTDPSPDREGGPTEATGTVGDAP